MDNASLSTRQLAKRLLRALRAADTLTPAQVRLLIPLLVEAEQAGEDVDSNPAFAALLRHLDANPESMALYVQLSEDLTWLLNDDTRPD
ncbi:MAG: hypothetical protein HC893_08680 [Chloroflexaceae bacterium]|nr:hypothetical protein [Chloroflexaceae bacterium]